VLLDVATYPAAEGGWLSCRLESLPLYLRDPEWGKMWFRAEHVPAQLPAPADAAWTFELGVADFRPGWLAAFARRLAAEPALRAQLPRSPTHSRHPTVRLELPTGPADVDERLAPVIAALNARGILTDHCCQGGDTRFPAYIVLRPGFAFPPELLAAWRGAGFPVTPQTVWARAPFGLWALAARRFQASCDDWVAGRLDLTGARYRTVEPRPPSLPVLPSPRLRLHSAADHPVPAPRSAWRPGPRPGADQGADPRRLPRLGRR
jgi:hypothetical protein